jgi:DNA (cytosine-5)-methyltransferase 1
VNELALFAGAGGGILGGKLLGWRTVCAVEVEPYPRDILLARQRDGILDPFPVWDDVRTFEGHPWRGLVDVVSGGFPCQDISVAGSGAGLDGERSGLWSEMARIIGEVRPRYVFAENSPMLVVRGLDRVLADLAALGFDVAWRVLSAADLGAPHLRERIWIVAHAAGAGSSDRDSGAIQGRTEHGRPAVESQRCGGTISNADIDLCEGLVEESQPRADGRQTGLHGGARSAPVWAEWPPESGIRRVVDGMAHRAHRIRAGGNGQVPRVAAAAFAELAQWLDDPPPQP